MSPCDLVAGMARKLALQFVAQDADRGISEHAIRLSWHGHSSPDSRKFPDRVVTKWTQFGGYDVSIGGWYDYDTGTGLARKKVPNTKVLVERVCNVEGVWIFSLHELYQECQKGQLMLL